MPCPANVGVNAPEPPASEERLRLTRKRSTHPLLDQYRTFLLTIDQYWTGLFGEDQISLFDQYQASLDQNHTTGQTVCVSRGSTGFRAPGPRRPAVALQHGKFCGAVHSCFDAEPAYTAPLLPTCQQLRGCRVSSREAAVSAPVELPCQQL